MRSCRAYLRAQMMQALPSIAPHDLLTKTLAVNYDLKNFIVTIVTSAVLPTLLRSAAMSFTAMHYTLGHQPGKAAASPPAADRHMN
jgi:hypothetical protein